MRYKIDLSIDIYLPIYLYLPISLCRERDRYLYLSIYPSIHPGRKRILTTLPQTNRSSINISGMNK